MDTEPERLEREILHTRERLGEDVDALVEKLDPRRLAAREAAHLRTTAAQHAGLVAAIGFGIGVLAVALLARGVRNRH